MLAWRLSGDGEIEEVEVEVNGALILPDDKLVRIIDIIGVLTLDVDVPKIDHRGLGR